MSPTRLFPLLALACLLVPVRANEEPAPKVWFPPPTTAELVGLLEHWDGPARATLVLRERPKSQLSRYLAWIDGDKVLAKTTATAKEGEEVALADILELDYARFGHRAISQIDRAIKAHAYDAALELIAKLEAVGPKARHIHVAQLKLVATRNKAVLDGLCSGVAGAAAGTDPDLVVAKLKDLIEAVEARQLPPAVAQAVEAGWNSMVGRMTPEQRAAWQEVAQGVRLTLKWDERAPEYLAEARTAFAAKDHPQAVAGFARAAKAHAAFEEDDYVAYGTALVETGKREAACDIFWRMQEATRRRPELRELFVKAGMMAPPFEPELLVLTWIGGKDDQAFNEVDFGPDGTITARGSSGLTAKYSADGTRLLGIAGDLNAPCEDKAKRNYAVKTTKTNPFDGTQWEYGYRQVHSILQQPHIISPHGWKWWKWWHSICEPKSLMADSRCIELWFPNPTHFITWVWSDGGNSTIDRHPMDLDQGNHATKGQYFGGGSKILRGVQATGELLSPGWNFGGRPADAVMDAYGNLYVAGTPRVGFKHKLFRSEGAGVVIYNAELQPQTDMCFGDVKLLGLAVRGNLLVVVGQVGRKAYTTEKHGKKQDHPAIDPKTAIQVHNPAQEQPGGDGEAFLAIVRLWQQGGAPAE